MQTKCLYPAKTKIMSKNIIGLAAIIFAVTLIVACHKTDVEEPQLPATLDSTAILGFADSTQLIKSITGYFLDSGSNIANDSSRILFLYDTVNRRITIAEDLAGATGGSLDSMIYQYNDEFFLSRISFIGSEYADDPTSTATIDYKYDADKVIQQAIFTEYGGNKYAYTFNKTILPGGGYRLSWLETSPYSGAGNTYLASFDAKGKLISHYYYLYSDSIVYDAIGNITKVLRTNYEKAYEITGSKTFPLYEFTARETKGDQLYNFNQILNRGIANLNFIDGGIGAELFSVDYVYQFTRFPATSMVLHRFTPYNSDCPNCPDYQITSNSQPVFDSQQRLLRYKVVFNDYPLTYQEFYIKYYK